LYGIEGSPCQPKSCTKKAFCHPDFPANVNFVSATWVAVEFDTAPSSDVAAVAQYDFYRNGGKMESEINTYFTFDTEIEVRPLSFASCGTTAWTDAKLLGSVRRKLQDAPTAVSTSEPTTAPTVIPTTSPTIASTTANPIIASTTAIPRSLSTTKKTTLAPTTLANADREPLTTEAPTGVTPSMPTSSGTVAPTTDAPSSTPATFPTTSSVTLAPTYNGNFLLCNSDVNGEFYVLTGEGSGEYKCEGKGRCDSAKVAIRDPVTNQLKEEDSVEVYNITGLSNIVIWANFTG
jgi:hypothetical protein